MDRPFYALLVGIDRYASPHVPPLGGCVNDVRAMAELLRLRFGGDPLQISILENEDATRAAIEAAFTWLIAQVRASGAQHVAPPAVLFHFSGHGSQAADPTRRKASGFDETLVCYDSRLPEHFDLKDWELGGWIDELAQYTDNITVILDCCHSGSGTRAGETNVVNVRSCTPDRRPQPASASPRATAMSGQPSAPTQARTPISGTANHVLLAACLNREKAYEYVPTAMNLGADIDPDVAALLAQRHGALTYFLLRECYTGDPTTLTYFELYETLRPQVAAHVPQTIQCEGDWGRLLFGHARPDRDLWLTVIERQGTRLVINGGAVHGVQVGTRLQAYGPEARMLAAAGPALGWLEVVDVGVAQSDCRQVAGDAEIPVNARLAPDLGTMVNQRRTLAIDVKYDQVATAIRARMAQPDLASLIALRGATGESDLRLQLLGQEFVLLAGNGSQLGPSYPMRELNPRRRPFEPQDFDPIAAALKRIVRVQSIEALENLGSPLAAAVVMDVKRLVVDAAGERQLAPLVEEADGLPLLPSGERFVIEVTNHYLDALYVGVLLISAGWEVAQLYPDLQGTHVMLASAQTVTIGDKDEHPLRLHLQGNSSPGQPIQGEVVSLLLIATKVEADFQSLLQREQALAERIRVQLDRVMRDLKFVPELDPADEWMVTRLRLRVVAE